MIEVEVLNYTVLGKVQYEKSVVVQRCRKVLEKSKEDTHTYLHTHNNYITN